MKGQDNSKGAAATGIIAAIAASSCCIPPVIAAIAGVGGISSSLSWMEPLRPYLIGLAVVGIGYAWYVNLKPKQLDDCGCEIDKPKFYQTKGFLIGMTVFAAASISFPYYSGIFFSSSPSTELLNVSAENLVLGNLEIDGMTCTGCEHHVNQVLNDSPGVVTASSSYDDGVANIQFDKSITSLPELAKSVEEETGYIVTNSSLKLER